LSQLDIRVESPVNEAVGSEPQTGTSVAKAMALLWAFDRATPIGVSELARKANLTKSTAFRLLSTLEQGQLVERVSGRYRLGTGLFELGNQVSYCSPRGLCDVAHPFLEDLYELTHETVHLAVVDCLDVLYIDKIFGRHPVRSPSRVGGRAPLHCTALGKALLAAGEPEVVCSVLSDHLQCRTPYTITDAARLEDALAQVRRDGTAFDREEAELGLTCVSAPVYNRRGATVAAISVSGATGRFDPAMYANKVRRSAAAISDRLYN
jgi:DNA-binding IclR family transcriptional regulator